MLRLAIRLIILNNNVMTSLLSTLVSRISLNSLWLCVNESSRKPGGGGVSREFLVGMCPPLLQVLTLFQTKQCHFPHLFSDQTAKIHTRFQTWPLGRNYSSLLRLERKQKSSSNVFWIRIFLFRSYSFGIEKITPFVNSCSSLENHTRNQTKMVKVYTRFQTKKAQEPYPLGGTYLYVLYKGIALGL